MRGLVPFAAFFSVVGAAVGFLLRPTDIFGHQLPLSVVLTRGNNLHGFNQLLIPLAQRSFNETLAGALIGLVLGIILAALARRH